MMSEAHDLQADYEALLELLYLCPFTVARINESGAIGMMNSMGAQLFMQFSAQPVLENLFEVIDPVAPELRQLVAGFGRDQGPICEGHRVYVGRVGGRKLPLVLTFTLIKLSPGAIMVAVADISRIEAADREKGVLLSNISDGLVSLDAAGRMANERSSALVRWLGPGQPEQTFWDYIAPSQPEVAALFKLGWDTLWEDVLPLELCLDQMPKRLQAGAVTLRIHYTPLFEDQRLSQVMLVLSDMTNEIERERLEEDQQELMAAVTKLARDRAAFRAFFEDATTIVESLKETHDLAAQRRLLHTLKGNVSFFGLKSVVTLCHQIEDHIAALDALPAEDLQRLLQRWAVLSERFAAFLGSPGGRIEITTPEYSALLGAIRAGAPRMQLMHMVTDWLNQPIESRLSSFAEQLRELAQRLGKGAVEVTVDSAGLRHAAQPMAAFWSAFTHAVRNAADHGLETAEERRAAGKPTPAQVTLQAKQEGAHLVIELRDDGRGIDWPGLERRARAQGLPSETRADLVSALFADGVSTRDEVSEHSGRGVGLGALRAACQALGGTVHIESQRGTGTTLRCRLPRAATVQQAPSP